MKNSLALHALGLAALASFAHAQQVLGTITGQAAGDRFGAATLELPDQDGDGVEDVAVGVPGYNGGSGAVFCVSGQSLATGSGVTLVWILVPPGQPPGAAFGTSLALVG